MPAATLISSVPSFVSVEEHRAIVGSTPASFNDIPPVLRYKEDNVSITLDPPLEGFAAQNHRTSQGTLFVIERSF
jgi:nucleotide-sensitive chloride channel 1A